MILGTLYRKLLHACHSYSPPFQLQWGAEENPHKSNQSTVANQITSFMFWWVDNHTSLNCNSHHFHKVSASVPLPIPFPLQLHWDGELNSYRSYQSRKQITPVMFCWVCNNKSLKDARYPLKKVAPCVLPLFYPLSASVGRRRKLP
jgi:hypothetical protein